MAKTVNSAFDTFLSDAVRLDPDVSKQARSSRDWLVDQLEALPGKIDEFPSLYSEKHIHYGSFARKTKIRELDDLDMISCIAGHGCTYSEWGKKVTIHVPETHTLRGLCHDGTTELNSRLVINRYVKHLNEIPQYEKADIGRNESAAVLNLKSYTWSFDIVPGFFTAPTSTGETKYVIPDGHGHWMMTDPRRDQARVSDVNQKNKGVVLDVVRLLKYWNARATMPSASSYLLECIAVNFFASKSSTSSSYVDVEFGPLLEYLYGSILSTVLDPKGIQGDINGESTEDRRKISERALSDSKKATQARRAESDGDHETSIKIWREIFGDSFPKFG